MRFLVLLPLGVPGLVVNYLPYRLVGVLSQSAVGKYDDILATAKAAAAFIVFPLVWITLGWLCWSWWGPLAGVTAVVLAPVSGFAGLRLAELADRSMGALRALGLWVLGRRRFLHLQVERRLLREDMLAIAAELGV